MIYDWYKIINRIEFTNSPLYSKELTLNLVGVGEKKLVVYRGVGVGVVVDDVFLRVNLNSRNPFYFDGYGIFQDNQQNIYVGFGRED
jgi:hypothetical protein